MLSRWLSAASFFFSLRLPLLWPREKIGGDSVPLVIAFIVALAGLATWLKYKSHQAPVQRLSVGNEGAPSGGFFSLSHPTLPKAPIVRTWRGDFAAPDSIRLSFNPIYALSKFFRHDMPSIPTVCIDAQLSTSSQPRVQDTSC